MLNIGKLFKAQKAADLQTAIAELDAEHAEMLNLHAAKTEELKQDSVIADDAKFCEVKNAMRDCEDRIDQIGLARTKLEKS
jgi:hypothetical protein